MDGTMAYQILSTLFFLTSGLGIFFKFSNRFAVLEEKVIKMEQNDMKQDNRYATILSSLNNVEQSIVRMETKIEMMENK